MVPVPGVTKSAVPVCYRNYRYQNSVYSRAESQNRTHEKSSACFLIIIQRLMKKNNSYFLIYSRGELGYDMFTEKGDFR